MDADSITKIVILALLILCSAYFSATETAFSAMNRIRMKTMAEENKRAALALKLSDNYDKLLSTILVGNNLVNIAATSIATILFVKHFHDLGATLSTVVMTIVVLIFGEVSPKSLAKDSPEQFAMFSAPILRVLMLILTPVNAFFTVWKKMLSRLFKTKADVGITEEELLTLVDEAENDGGIDAHESELMSLDAHLGAADEKTLAMQLFDALKSIEAEKAIADSDYQRHLEQIESLRRQREILVGKRIQLIKAIAEKEHSNTGKNLQSKTVRKHRFAVIALLSLLHFEFWSWAK